MQIDKAVAKELLTNLILEFGNNPIPLKRFNEIRDPLGGFAVFPMTEYKNAYARYMRMNTKGDLIKFNFGHLNDGSTHPKVVIVITQAGLDLLNDKS